MAIGASEALTEKGSNEIQIVGIDGVDEVRRLVEEKKVLGTVLCDTQLHAEALLQFIDYLAVNEKQAGEMELEDERYYMIPLSKIEQ